MGDMTTTTTTPTPATLTYSPRYCDDGAVAVLILADTPDGGLRVRRRSDGVEYEVLRCEVEQGLVTVTVDRVALAVDRIVTAAIADYAASEVDPVDSWETLTADVPAEVRARSALALNLCPIHGCDAGICGDDDPEACRDLRRVLFDGDPSVPDPVAFAVAVAVIRPEGIGDLSGYPVTARTVSGLARTVADASGRIRPTATTLAREAVSAVVGYEHGDADLPAGVTVEQYAAMANDLIACVVYADA